jgi:hypothetical protein
VPRVPLHEEAGIAVPAIDLASRVRIDAVVKDLRLVEDAFGLDFFDDRHAIQKLHKPLPMERLFDKDIARE